MKRIFTILFFTLWTFVAFSQTTKDSLTELQSLLDSIPDISLAELGIDTTDEIVPDTLHLVIPASIASDTTYARNCLNQAIELFKVRNYTDAYAKADTAKHIYQMNIGYVSKEVADCMFRKGLYKDNENMFHLAIEYYEKSLRIKLKQFRSDYLGIAQLLHNLGILYNDLGYFQKSIDFNNQALKIRISSFGKFNLDVAHTYNNLAIPLQYLGRNDESLENFKKALDIRIKILGKESFDVVNSYVNIGIIYEKKGEYNLALNYYKTSYELSKLILEVNENSMSALYSNWGISHFKKGEYIQAIKYQLKSLDSRLKIFGKNHPQVMISYNNLGVSYERKGDFKEAISYYYKAFEIGKKIFSEDHFYIGGILNNLAICYKELGDYNNAIEFNKKALSIRINVYGQNHELVGASYNALGNTYKSEGKYDKAIEYYHRALDILMKTLGNYHPDLGAPYIGLGIAYDSQGEYEKAIEYYLSALDIQIKTLGKDHPDIGLSYINLGHSYESKEEYEKAIEYFQKSLYNRHITLEKTHPDVLISQKSLINVYLKTMKIDSCHFYTSQAISSIKSQMASDNSAETKNLYQSQNIPVFESAIDVSLIKSKKDQHDSLKIKTFEYTELAKASLLQSQIKQTDALAFAGIPDSLLQKEYDLRIDINWREKQRQGLLEKGKEETDTTVLRISNIIFDLKREQEGLFETLEKDYPEYYRLKYDTKTISLEDTQQKLLQKGQTLLEYFVGDSSIFIFVIRPDTFDVVQVKKDFPLDSLVKQMQSGLFGYYGQSADKRSDGLYKQTIQDYSDASHQLYQRIVAPVEQLLTQDLIIVPDGVLGYVPFEALLKSKPEKVNQFGTYPYMINDHNIAYNYSATLWNEMKNKKHKKEPLKSLVAFAPFYQGSFEVLDSTINLVFDTLPDGRDTTIFQDVVTRRAYNPLPSSGIEAASISKMYKGDYFVNTTATEQKFYDIAGDYRFIHLSTHGVADARQGDYSYLAFAEQKDSIENEFLYVRDIYNTQLNADLVFLSACETAQGELQRGEGIISLARAFAYAGAKSIITTLWQVDDTATKDISIEFYKNLKKGMTKDVALRQAKHRHIKSAKSAQKHPFFWAAMIGIGDMGQVKN